MKNNNQQKLVFPDNSDSFHHGFEVGCVLAIIRRPVCIPARFPKIYNANLEILEQITKDLGLGIIINSKGEESSDITIDLSVDKRPMLKELDRVMVERGYTR